MICQKCKKQKYGIDNRNRGFVSSSKSDKRDDGTYQVIKSSRLL